MIYSLRNKLFQSEDRSYWVSGLFTVIIIMTLSVREFSCVRWLWLWIFIQALNSVESVHGLRFWVRSYLFVVKEMEVGFLQACVWACERGEQTTLRGASDHHNAMRVKYQSAFSGRKIQFLIPGQKLVFELSSYRQSMNDLWGLLDRYDWLNAGTTISLMIYSILNILQKEHQQETPS